MPDDVTPDRQHCCDELREQVEFRCPDHPNDGGCGDYLIGYNPTFDEYGAWIHTGQNGQASSWLTVAFCPFCGAKLAPSRREEWFDRLDASGLEPEDAPDELGRYGWWLQD